MALSLFLARTPDGGVYAVNTNLSTIELVRGWLEEAGSKDEVVWFESFAPTAESDERMNIVAEGLAALCQLGPFADGLDRLLTRLARGAMDVERLRLTMANPGP